LTEARTVSKYGEEILVKQGVNKMKMSNVFTVIILCTVAASSAFAQSQAIALRNSLNAIATKTETRVAIEKYLGVNLTNVRSNAEWVNVISKRIETKKQAANQNEKNSIDAAINNILDTANTTSTLKASEVANIQKIGNGTSFSQLDAVTIGAPQEFVRTYSKKLAASNPNVSAAVKKCDAVGCWKLAGNGFEGCLQSEGDWSASQMTNYVTTLTKGVSVYNSAGSGALMKRFEVGPGMMVAGTRGAAMKAYTMTMNPNKLSVEERATKAKKLAEVCNLF
jgi:hypothetical protein